MLTFIVMALIAVVFGAAVAWAFFHEKILFYFLGGLLLVEGSLVVIMAIGLKPIPLLIMQIPNIVAALFILGTQILHHKRKQSSSTA